MNMKGLLPFLLLAFAASAYAQSGNFATATRAVNNKLIGITNIIGLSDCPSTEFSGTVKKIKQEPDALHFRLWNKVKNGKKSVKEIRNVDIRLERIAPADRPALSKELIKRGFVLRVSGYDCNSGGVILAFSVDRIYKPVKR
jgi:hypothetical protein